MPRLFTLIFFPSSLLLVVSVIDLDKELAPNGLDLSFTDVQLIIGILYCVGAIEISPQRIASLIVVAQVLGIPSLINFLKRVRESSQIEIPNNHEQFESYDQLPDRRGLLQPQQHPLQQNQQPALVYVLPPAPSSVHGANISNVFQNNTRLAAYPASPSRSRPFTTGNAIMSFETLSAQQPTQQTQAMEKNNPIV